MIIFDLDDCLANCDHRKHLLDPNSYPEICEYSNYRMVDGKPFIDLEGRASWRYKLNGEPFSDGLKSFNEDCEKDEPIIPVTKMLFRLLEEQDKEIQIWSGRCESVRDKTEKWLTDLLVYQFGQYLDWEFELQMRPIGNSTPDDVLKEKWLYEELAEGKTIDYVFDAHKKSISMWRSRGVFVFNCMKPRW